MTVIDTYAIMPLRFTMKQVERWPAALFLLMLLAWAFVIWLVATAGR